MLMDFIGVFYGFFFITVENFKVVKIKFLSKKIKLPLKKASIFFMFDTFKRPQELQYAHFLDGNNDAAVKNKWNDLSLQRIQKKVGTILVIR